jgi:hypothetical protein
MESQCTLCSKTFKNANGLKIHDARIHKNKNISVAPSVVPSNVESMVNSLFTKNLEMFDMMKKEREEERLEREKERQEECQRREEERLQREKERQEECQRREEERLQREKERQEECQRREEERLQREKERQEERQRREEERLQKEKERQEERQRREEERLQKEKERELRDREFERQRKMLMDIEDRKDKRWNEYIQIQTRALDEWSETMKQEREARERYLEIKEKRMHELNWTNRRLSIADDFLHQKDEMVVFGTSSCPLFESGRLKQYVKDVVFDNPPPGLGEMIADMCGLVDSMSTVMICQMMGMKFDHHIPETKETHYIEVLSWESVVEDVEHVLEIPEDYVSMYIGRVSLHMPYSKPEHEWKQRRDSIKKHFMHPPSLKKNRYKKDIPTPDGEHRLETVENNPDEYCLRNSTVLEERDVVGGGDESVSSTARHSLMRQQLLKRLRDILANDFSHHKRQWLHQRWAIMSGRMMLVMERVYQNGYYIPDGIIRYIQDTKFKIENSSVEPGSRALWKRRFFGNQNMTKCQMCFQTINVDSTDWQRAHIIPSKKPRLVQMDNIISSCVVHRVIQKQVMSTHFFILNIIFTNQEEKYFQKEN